MRGFDQQLGRYGIHRIGIVMLVVGSSGLSLAAQFGLPKVKIPKLPGQKTSTTAKTSNDTKSSLPPPEVTTIEPESGPPGGSGQITLTGKNFNSNLRLALNCTEGSIPVTQFQVVSPERATFTTAIPANSKEQACGLQFTHYDKVGGSDDQPSLSGTPEVYPVRDSSPKFKVSASGKLPVAFASRLLGEGDMQFMDMMMKMQKAMMPGFGNENSEGKLTLADGNLKYLQGDKMVFTEPVSGVKDIAEMKQGGQPIGIFRIVFKDGKIYNFMGVGENQQTHQTFELLKKQLGK